MAGRNAVRRRSAGALVGTGLIAVAGLLLVGGGFVAPVLRAIVPVFHGAPETGQVAALAPARIGRLLSFTLLQALASSLAALLVGLPLAYLFAHYRFPGRELLYAGTLVPFVLPSIIVVVAMVGFFGTSGLLQSLLGIRSGFLYGFAGIVLAHVYYDFSLGVRVIAPAWAALDARHIEAAKSLGDGKAGRFFRITLPLIAPAAINGFLLMFLYTFLSFGIVLVFGGVQAATLEVAIYQSWFFELDLRMASLLALLQLVFLGSILFLSNAASSRMSVPDTSRRRMLPHIKEAPPLGRILSVAYLVLLSIFLFGPLVVLGVRAVITLFSGGLTTIGSGPRDRDISTILRSTIGAVIVRSVLMAIASGGSAFLIATTIALRFRRASSAVVSTITELPIAMSMVTLAIGFSLLWDTLVPPILQVIVLQTIVAVPVAYRVVRAGVESLGERPLEVAESLGASRTRRLIDIELPLLRPVLLNGLAYALAISFADLTAVLVVGRGRIVTFPVAIYRLIGFRSFDSAIALAFVYLMLCGSLFFLLQRAPARRSL